MKKQTLYRIAGSVLFLLFGSLAASAQSQEYLITVQVPFDFQVNEKLLPAGEYVIRCDSQTRRLRLIQRTKQNILESVYTIPLSLSKEPARTSLIFKKYGEKHFLSEVKVEGRGDGYALIKSKAERRLAQLAEARTIRTIPSDPGQTTDHD